MGSGSAYRQVASVLCAAGLPVLRIDRLYRDRELRPLEPAVNHFNPDRYSYRLQLRRVDAAGPQAGPR